MVRQHQLLNGHESEQTPGDSEGQGSLACCMQSTVSQRVRHDLGTGQQQNVIDYLNKWNNPCCWMQQLNIKSVPPWMQQLDIK